jgi:hypothetical protein
MWLYTIPGICITGIILLLISTYLLSYYFSSSTENFTDTSSSDENDIKTIIDFLNTNFCPSYSQIVSNYSQNESGQPIEPTQATYDTMSKEAATLLKPSTNTLIQPLPKITLIKCPLTTDVFSMPVDIDVSLKQTIQYTEIKLKKLLETLQSSLQCKGLPSKTTEGFASPSICTPDQEKIKLQQAQEEAEKNTLNTCILSSSIDPEMKKQLTKARLATLNSVMNDQTIQQSIVDCEATSKQLKTLKEQAESGTLTVQC